MVTKKNIFIGSTIATALSFLWEYVGYGKVCKSMDGVDYQCLSILRDAELVILPIVTLIIIILLLSLITYWMKEKIFHAWWNFARWMVPIIILATIAIQFVPKNGGFFNMDSLIYLMVLVPLYTVLILVSLALIGWKWFVLRKNSLVSGS